MSKPAIFYNDPDGHIVELATAGPWFTADEEEAALGNTLKLPPWLEPQRAQIAAGLKPLALERQPQEAQP